MGEQSAEKDSDEELIALYNKGGKEQLRTLIERYTKPLYNFLLRFAGTTESEDLVQEIFIKVWKNLPKFKPERASFKTWLFTIARNSVTDYLRKKKTLSFSDVGTSAEESFENTVEDPAPLPSEVLDHLAEKDALNKVLDKLPHNYREVLVLHYQEELTFDEIGQILNKPLNTVKSWHRRALIQLKSTL
jgi:RNA polymerase sigma-70 factor (ECF subfamily)